MEEAGILIQQKCAIEEAKMLIRGKSVSEVWAKCFLKAMAPGGKIISPLLIQIDLSEIKNLDEVEIPAIKKLLDKKLFSYQKENEVRTQSTDTVAGTIFPIQLWNRKKSASVLYRRYLRILPRLMEMSSNHKGLYFQRLIAYGFKKELSNFDNTVNQLEKIIELRKGKKKSGEFSLTENHRTSVLQCSLFDPFTDHLSTRYLGFPCLQQISFVPDELNKTLSMNAFYSMQYLFVKAYGNYLGLCHLGEFVAHELWMKLTRLNCYVGKAELDTKNKGSFKSFNKKIEVILNEKCKEEPAQTTWFDC